MTDQPMMEGKDLVIIYNTSPFHEEFANDLYKAAVAIVSENTVVVQCNQEQLINLDIRAVMSIEVFTTNAQDSLMIKEHGRTDEIWQEARMSRIVNKVKAITVEDLVMRIERIQKVRQVWDGHEGIA